MLYSSLQIKSLVTDFKSLFISGIKPKSNLQTDLNSNQVQTDQLEAATVLYKSSSGKLQVKSHANIFKSYVCH